MYFCSQYRDIKDEGWKHRGCTISALWMGLKMLKEDFNLTPDELLKEAISIKAYADVGFWKHDSIAILAHNHGVGAYNEEFKSRPFGIDTEYSESILEYGINKIFNFVKNKEGVVIVSVPKAFQEIDKPHSVIIHDAINVEGKRYFIYHDSEKDNEELGMNLRVDLETFKEKWRRLGIFLNKIKK